MGRAFLNASGDEVVARLGAVAAEVAGAPVVVRVGEDTLGFRNVGVDLPAGKRTAAARRLLVNRMRNALEVAGMALVETAIAPKVDGHILGNVRVREVAVNWADASQLARPPSEK